MARTASSSDAALPATVPPRRWSFEEDGEDGTDGKDGDPPSPSSIAISESRSDASCDISSEIAYTISHARLSARSEAASDSMQRTSEGEGETDPRETLSDASADRLLSTLSVVGSGLAVGGEAATLIGGGGSPQVATGLRTGAPTRSREVRGTLSSYRAEIFPGQQPPMVVGRKSASERD
jgi:hypothetical protein